MRLFDSKIFTFFSFIIYFLSFICYDFNIFWRFKFAPSIPELIGFAIGYKLGDIVILLPCICLSSYIIRKLFLKENTWLYTLNIGLMFQAIVNILYSAFGIIITYMDI